MANRRMFSRSVVGSSRFLRMPQSSRLLYYDLGMEADDDGFVEAFGVIRKTGAAEDDLRILVSRGFVKIVNDDLVAFITDWKQNNYIRPDRYTKSVYHKLLTQIGGNLPLDNQMDTVGIPAVVETDPQDRLGKDSVGKGSIESTADKPPAPTKPPRKSHGEFGWVKLTDEEYNRLLNDLGEAEVSRCIAYVDESAQSTGNKNKWKDWNLVLRRCHREGWGLNQRQPPKKPNSREHGIDHLSRLYEEEFGN